MVIQNHLMTQGTKTAASCESFPPYKHTKAMPKKQKTILAKNHTKRYIKVICFTFMFQNLLNFHPKHQFVYRVKIKVYNKVRFVI